MSRSGYNEDYGGVNLWRGTVASAIRGQRGQRFLKELGEAMDQMPQKRLIAHELISETGEVCAIGVVCKAKNIPVKNLDIDDRDVVGGLVDIAGAMAAEIEFINDEYGPRQETPEQRWIRMRKWVAENIK